MRKVYHTEKNTTGLITAVLLSVGLTGVLFGILPFTHIISKPPSIVQLVRATTIELPPAAETEAPPPPPEEDKPPEAPPEVKLAEVTQQIALSADLDVAVGTGGGLAGFGAEVRSLATAETGKEDVFDASELQKLPEAVSRVQPVYPAELRKAKIEGKVMLLCLVTADGRVEDVRVESSSRPEFEKPALDAFRKWKFRPGKKDGQDVGAYLRQPMSFHVSTK